MAETTKRRTGKAGQTNSQQSAEVGGQHMQSRLQEKADEVGLMLADNFQAHALMVAIKSMESGSYGPKTAAILEALEGGASAPLENWSSQIQSWHQPALPSSVSESNG